MRAVLILSLFVNAFTVSGKSKQKNYVTLMYLQAVSNDPTNDGWEPFKRSTLVSSLLNREYSRLVSE